ALPADYAFTSRDTGSHTFSVVLQTLATQLLMVADKSNQSVASGSASLMVNLAAPSNLKATAVSASQIYLTWQDNSTNETGIQIERSLDGETWVLLTTVGPNATSYSDTGLTAGTTYYYRVRAVSTETIPTVYSDYLNEDSM